MRTLKKNICVLGLALAAMAAVPLSAQPWYGQLRYPHDSTILSSAKRTFNNPGYVMAGFRPVRQTLSSSPDFVIDKVDGAGLFSSATDFSRNYQITLSCPSQVVVRQCSGVSVIETNNQGGGEAYALAGACEWGMFFATLSSNGGVISRNFWPFPSVSSGVKKPAIRESVSHPGEYYICGSYNSEGYVVRVKANGTPIWGNFYYNGAVDARDLIESPYNPNELIVVGRGDVLINPPGTDALVMSLKANSGLVNWSNRYNFLSWDSNDWLACIEIANSPTGGKGYIMGGRAVGPTVPPFGPGTPTNARYSQWMCKIDPNGNVIWTTLVKPKAAVLSPLIAAPEINRVFERLNPNTGVYEYYGVGGSFYTYSGGVVSGADNLVVFKLDDNGNIFTGSASEYHFLGNTALPLNTYAYYSDMTGMETGGSDDGLQMFGTDLFSQEHYFTKSYFNGVVGCNQNIADIDSIFPGPDLFGIVDLHITPFGDCGPLSIGVQAAGGSISNNCYASSVNNGSNARTTGLTSQTIDERAVKVYPNPTNGVLRISVEGPAQVSVYNSLGQRIAVPALKTGEIDFSSLGVAPGCYIVEVNANGETSRHKVMYKAE